MQDRISPIPTPDTNFHDGNPATGTLGTIVSANWLNNIQSATISSQEELLTVIKDSGQSADPKRKDQLLQAVKKLACNGSSRPSTLAGYGIVDGVTQSAFNLALDKKADKTDLLPLLACLAILPWLPHPPGG